MSREENRKIALETAGILQQGWYQAGGRTIALDMHKAAEAVIIRPDDKERTQPAEGLPIISVTPSDTVSAAISARNPEDALVLNFASAVNPGGGFLTGASAQEEALCRASTLYSSLISDEASEMYRKNREADCPYYLDYAVFSPHVAFFRSPDGRLLEHPSVLSVLTMAAVNRYRRNIRKEIADDIMRKRIRRILALAADFGKQDLILGAWGCGVFGNDAEDVAGWFHQAINEYGGLFRQIEFAILPGGGADNLTPFIREFRI